MIGGMRARPLRFLACATLAQSGGVPCKTPITLLSSECGALKKVDARYWTSLEQSACHGRDAYEAVDSHDYRAETYPRLSSLCYKCCTYEHLSGVDSNGSLGGSACDGRDACEAVGVFHVPPVLKPQRHIVHTGSNLNGLARIPPHRHSQALISQARVLHGTPPETPITLLSSECGT